MAQITVISDVERQRQWNDDQKLALIQAAMAPDASVAVVARDAAAIWDVQAPWSEPRNRPYIYTARCTAERRGLGQSRRSHEPVGTVDSAGSGRATLINIRRGTRCHDAEQSDRFGGRGR